MTHTQARRNADDIGAASGKRDAHRITGGLGFFFKAERLRGDFVVHMSLFHMPKVA